MPAAAAPSDNLYVFGYGSLVWRPSPDLETASCSQGILQGPYVRAWAQYSTDHRGNERCFGVVCNLLRTDEITDYFRATSVPRVGTKYHEHEGGVLGSLYLLPEETRAKALADLDVREKGGYEREIVDVLLVDDDEEGGAPALRPVKAILYRGSAMTDDVTRSGVGNFWGRVLYDEEYKVKVMASAIGPSGWNGDYVMNLDDWLSSMAAKYGPSIPSLPEDPATRSLCRKLKKFIAAAKENDVANLFAYAVGNNEHNQLGIANPPADAAGSPSRPFDAANLDQISNGFWEVCLSLARYDASGGGLEEHPSAVPRVALADLQCGGAHSAALTTLGQCYIWGNDDCGQLGKRSRLSLPSEDFASFAPIEIPDITNVALGHAHTVLVSSRAKLHCFGSNSHNQCTPPSSIFSSASTVSITSVSAGPQTSSCVTSAGIVHVWGCNKDNQCSPLEGFKHPSHPGVNFVQSACGMRHTVLLDSEGVVWGVGNGKFGQLGDAKVAKSAALAKIEIPGLEGAETVRLIDCGWSHCVAVTSADRVFGWGRTDLGHLGLSREASPSPPVLLPLPPETLDRSNDNNLMKEVKCGPEGTIIMSKSGKAYGCGYNEHGTLGVGDCKDRFSFVEMKVDGSALREGLEHLAVGGAHVLMA